MCKYCEGVLGRRDGRQRQLHRAHYALDGRLSIDYEHGGCCLNDIYDYCSIPISHCSMCERDLRGGER
nr:MAG TPA: hypothetical protein [Caudoviricetes sp.]